MGDPGLVAAASGKGELATPNKVALQRLAGHAELAENRIRPLVDQVKLALAAEFTGLPLVPTAPFGCRRLLFCRNVHRLLPRANGSPLLHQLILPLMNVIVSPSVTKLC